MQTEKWLTKLAEDTGRLDYTQGKESNPFDYYCSPDLYYAYRKGWREALIDAVVEESHDDGC